MCPFYDLWHMCNGKDTPNSRNSRTALRKTDFPFFKVIAGMPWLKWIITRSACGCAFTTSMNEWKSMWANKRSNQHTFLKRPICKLKGNEKVFRWKSLEIQLNRSPPKLLLSVSFEKVYILSCILLVPFIVLELIIVFQAIHYKINF